MSNTNYIGFARGVSTNFSPAAADSNTLYFLTDTNQFFLGGEEYSKGVEELTSAPTANLVGIEGKLYIYNNILYTYLNNNWTITGFTNWTMLNGFPEDSDFHFLAYQDQDPDVSPAVMIPLSVIKTNLGTSGSGDIADGSITTIKIADGAVTKEKLAENSVSSTQIAGYTIGHLEIAKNAIYTDALQDSVVTPEKLDRTYLERRRLWTTITTWTDLFNTVVLSTDIQHPTTLQFMLSCEAPLPNAYTGTGLTIQRGICWATSANTIFIHSMNNMNCVWRIQKKTSSTSAKLNYQKSETVDGITYYYIIELMQTQSDSIANKAITPTKLDRTYAEYATGTFSYHELSNHTGSNNALMNGTYSLIGDICILNVGIGLPPGRSDLYYPLPVVTKHHKIELLYPQGTAGSSSADTDIDVSKSPVLVGIGWKPSSVASEQSGNDGILQIKTLDGSYFETGKLSATIIYNYK